MDYVQNESIYLIKYENQRKTYKAAKDIANCISRWYTHVKYSQPHCFLVNTPV